MGNKTLRFRRRPDPQGLEQYSRIYYQLQDERRVAASGKIDALLKRTATEKLSELVEQPALRTFGALEYLGTIFNTALTSDPQRAKAIAELEVSIAENLPPNRYHRITIVQTLCYAWRNIGVALRTLGRLEDSLEALAVAERELPQHGVLLHDIAIVRMSTAMTLQEMQRFEEARKYLAQSKLVFAEYGDDKRLVLATFCEGVLLQRMKHHREAREAYLSLLSSGYTIELSVRAAIYRAIGFASIELGHYDEAETTLARSIDLHRQLSQPIEVVRGQYAFGRLLVQRGDAERAVTYLRPVRRDFLQHGLTEEAGLCGLEIVEGMLILGNHTGAENLARKIISEFVKAGLNQRAITALGYLEEAIASSQASNTLVQAVREYIVSLRTSPERDFPHVTASGPAPGKSPER